MHTEPDMAKVLLIDDDSELTTLLSEYLVEEGFQVETSEDARVGIASAADQSVDIIVLDVMMPRMNGIDALQRIRRLGDVPVLMLTAKGDDIDRISGLNLGADDYVAKPCSPGELVARIRAILRRAGSRPGDENILQVISFFEVINNTIDERRFRPNHDQFNIVIEREIREFREVC